MAVRPGFVAKFLPGSGGIGRAFRNRNYRIYTIGNALSLIGTWVQRIGVGWLTWEMTHSGMWLAIVALAEFMPSLIAGPLGGAAADRMNRVKLTVICQTLCAMQAFALGALTLMGLMTPTLLAALTLVLGVLTAFNQAARMSMIPSLVRREDVAAAVAINSVIWNSARFVGPAAAAALIVGAGIGWAFVANGLSFVSLLIALFLLRIDAPATGVRRDAGMFQQIGEGIGYVWRHGAIGPLILLLLATSMCARPFSDLLPGFADAVFGAGADGLALMNAATGVGAVVAGIWLGQFGRSARMVDFAIGNSALMGLALIAFTATDWFPLAVAALAFAGFALVASGVATQSLLQESTDPAMLGRVLSIYGLTFRAGPALGTLAMGAASEYVGLRFPVAVGGGLCIVAWYVMHCRRTRIRAALETRPTADDRIG